MKKNRLFTVLSVVVFTTVLFGVAKYKLANAASGYGQVKKFSDITKSDITQKVHFKEMLKMKTSNQSDDEYKSKLDKYIHGMDYDTLMLTIAETSEEAESWELMLFNDDMDKVSNSLTASEYEKILKSSKFNDAFKEYISEIYIGNEKKVNGKLAKSTTKLLRDSIKNNKDNTMLAGSLIMSIDDYDSSDVQLMNDILSSSSVPEVKTIAAKKLSDIDDNEGIKYYKKVVENKGNYSDKEVNSALLNLSYTLKNKNINNGKKELIDSAENLIKTKDKNYKETAVHVLGNLKDKDAVKTMANNIDNINDDSLIRYNVDKSFKVINDMLIPTNDYDTIMTALKLCNIAKYTEFSENITTLENNSNADISSLAKKVNESISKGNFHRNSKWDEM